MRLIFTARAPKPAIGRFLYSQTCRRLHRIPVPHLLFFVGISPQEIALRCAALHSNKASCGPSFECAPYFPISTTSPPALYFCLRFLLLHSALRPTVDLNDKKTCVASQDSRDRSSFCPWGWGVASLQQIGL